MATIKIKRGSGQPNLTGLTAYEPAWDTTFNRLFIHAGTTAMWIGSQVVDDTTLAGNCAYFIPSQRAVKTYVDNSVASGAVTNVNGATGAITIGGGTAISIATSTAARGITVTNTGVWSVNGTTGAVTNIAVTNAAQTFTGLQTFSNGISVAGGTFTGTQTFVNGATFSAVSNFVGGLCASNAIISGGTYTGTQTFVNGATFNAIANFLGGLCASNVIISGGLTFNGNAVTTTANTVTGITGTVNQITVSGNTGSVTLSLPSAITTPGSMTVSTDLTVTGNLTVNGTSTTVNSTTVTIQDPLIAIGGVTGNAPPPVGDTKDRGIVFQWATGVTGQTGFFGFDQSVQRFTYITSGATVSSEIVSGAAGNANFAGIFAPQGTLTLRGECAANASVILNGAATAAATTIVNTAYETEFTSSTGVGRLKIDADLTDPSLTSTITPTTLTGTRTFTLPDITGTGVVADTGGATSGWLLRGAGATTVNSWINPNASGFTAFTSTNTNLVAVKDGLNYGLIFALGTAGNQIFYGDSTTGIMWRPSTNTLTVGAGVGFFEGIVEGGTF